MEHTPLPWRNESGILHAKYPNPTDTVHPARCENEVDAEFVERAVNNYYQFLAALERLSRAVVTAVSAEPHIFLGKEIDDAQYQARATIEEARK